jgi:antitoxin CptB
MRGWLELDLVFGQWAQLNIPSMTEKDLDELEVVINLENPDLMNWFFENKEVSIFAQWFKA